MIWTLVFRIGMLLGTVTLLGGLYWHYTYTIAENKRLTQELKTANATIKAVDTIVEEHNVLDAREDELITVIETERATYDAPTAPVLYNAIKRLH